MIFKTAFKKYFFRKRKPTRKPSFDPIPLPDMTISPTSINIVEPIVIDFENGKYNLESLFRYWNENANTIENELKNQFNVYLKIKLRIDYNFSYYRIYTIQLLKIQWKCSQKHFRATTEKNIDLEMFILVSLKICI